MAFVVIAVQEVRKHFNIKKIDIFVRNEMLTVICSQIVFMNRT